MSPRSKKQFAEIREVSRKKILDASLELFGTKGYETTSINDVARKAGVSKGLLYHYFESKEDIVKQLIDDLTNRADGVMEEVFSDDPKETMRTILQMFFNEMRNNFDQWQLIMNLSVQIEKFGFVHDVAVTKMKVYLELFEQLFTQMEWENPAAEAKQLGALFDGIGIQYFLIKDDYHLDEMEKILMEKYCK